MAASAPSATSAEFQTPSVRRAAGSGSPAVMGPSGHHARAAREIAGQTNAGPIPMATQSAPSRSMGARMRQPHSCA